MERETLTLDTKYAGSRKNRTIGRCETKTCNCASVLPRSSTRYFAKTIPTDFRNSFTDSAVDLHSWSPKIPPQLECVTTLPCEIFGTFPANSGMWPLRLSHNSTCIFLHRRNRYGSTSADNIAENVRFNGQFAVRCKPIYSAYRETEEASVTVYSRDDLCTLQLHGHHRQWTDDFQSRSTSVTSSPPSCFVFAVVFCHLFISQRMTNCIC